MIARLSTYFTALTTCLVLFVGWRLRDFEIITAEYGMGYFLGIAGAALMLLLLGYPLRKRVPIFGDIKSWFRLHMVLGIAGPVLILFHANFHLGSLNSRVALYSMLIVALSGVVGRFIYARFHHGLYGHRATLSELRQRLQDDQEIWADLSRNFPPVYRELNAVAEQALTAEKSFHRNAIRALSAGIRMRRSYHKIRSHVRRSAKAGESGFSRREQRRLLSDTRRFLHHAQAVLEFDFFRRLFAFWHIVHLPLFYMLILAAVVHVFAVHFY